MLIFRHSLAQQKENDENSFPSVIRTPIKKISVPSYSSSINGSSVYHTNYQSSIVDNNADVGNVNGGSDSNLSRSYSHQQYVNSFNGNGCSGYERNVEYSMRKQLLRRLCRKDVKTISRPSSLSPPSRRATLTTRRGQSFDPSSLSTSACNAAESNSKSTVHQCEECQRLGFDRNTTEFKRLRLTAGRSLDSSIIKPKSNQLIESSHPVSNSSPATTSSSDRFETEQELHQKHKQQIRKSVLIYMTSLDKTDITDRVDRNGCAPFNAYVQKEKSEESVDSGNGETTQNLDNLTSSSDTDAANNLQNNNQISNNTKDTRNRNNNHSSSIHQETRQETEDEYVAQVLIKNMEANGVEVKTNNQSYDHENNLVILHEDEENGNIAEVQYKTMARTERYDDQSTVNSYRIMSQSSDGHIQDVIVHDGTMSYFPSYSLVESRGDMSSYTSQCSDPDPEPLSAVASGSAYPELDFPYQVVVTRLSAVPRTMSMEVQPSSTGEEEELEPEYDSADDDTVSLVDSLDDPLSPRPQGKQGPRKSAESFFVPIADASVDDEHLVVSDVMPDKLKERLDTRQKRRDQKKQHETKVKVRAMQRIVERRASDPSNRTERKENMQLKKVKNRLPRDSSTSSTGKLVISFNFIFSGS